MRKLLNDQIRITERANLVQSRKFRETLEDAMVKHTNKAITTAEMISRLLDLARELREAQHNWCSNRPSYPLRTGWNGGTGLMPFLSRFAALPEAWIEIHLRIQITD